MKRTTERTITPDFRLRLMAGGRILVGPGRADLLRLVGKHGSLSRAAGEMGMSYRHAWKLLRLTSEALGREVVTTVRGGAAGGGRTRLTPAGRSILRRYDALEKAAAGALRTPGINPLPRRSSGPFR